MIRLSPRCFSCGHLNPAVQVLRLGWQVTECVQCHACLVVDCSPDAVLANKRKRRRVVKR